MTKKQMTEAIESWLRQNKGSEIVVTAFQYLLRNGRCGMKAYCIVSDDGVNTWSRPYSGANIVWLIPWKRLDAKQVKSIYDRLNV